MKLLFLTNNLPFSVIIRGVTSCEWSHTAVAFDDVVIESRFGGVSTTTLDAFKARGKHSIVNVPLKDEESARDFALSQVEKPYDFGGIFGFWFNRNIQDDTKWYCSELCAEVAKRGGVELVRSGLNGISPRDLWVLPNDVHQPESS